MALRTAAAAAAAARGSYCVSILGLASRKSVARSRELSKGPKVLLAGSFGPFVSAIVISSLVEFVGGGGRGGAHLSSLSAVVVVAAAVVRLFGLALHKERRSAPSSEFQEGEPHCLLGPETTLDVGHKTLAPRKAAVAGQSRGESLRVSAREEPLRPASALSIQRSNSSAHQQQQQQQLGWRRDESRESPPGDDAADGDDEPDEGDGDDRRQDCASPLSLWNKCSRAV